MEADSGKPASVKVMCKILTLNQFLATFFIIKHIQDFAKILITGKVSFKFNVEVK